MPFGLISAYFKNNFPTISVDAPVDRLWTTPEMPSGSASYPFRLFPARCYPCHPTPQKFPSAATGGRSWGQPSRHRSRSQWASLWANAVQSGGAAGGALQDFAGRGQQVGAKTEILKFWEGAAFQDSSFPASQHLRSIPDNNKSLWQRYGLRWPDTPVNN